MDPERFGRPIPLGYQSRFRTAIERPHPGVQLDAAVTATLRATAGLVALGSLMVAVPCLVCTLVGLCFGDAAAVESIGTAGTFAGVGTGAGIFAFACHSRICRRRSALASLASWN